MPINHNNNNVKTNNALILIVRIHQSEVFIDMKYVLLVFRQVCTKNLNIPFNDFVSCNCV